MIVLGLILLVGGWLAGISILTTIGVVLLVIGALLAVCSLEFVGPAERDGWKLAATLTPITYIAWSLWLVACGIALLL